jgi:PST family polysaccharide transporter
VESGGELRRRAVRSAGVTVFAQGIGFAVQMVSTVALARLLRPVDFGLVTMVTTFSVLIASCGQIGFPEAVVQRQKMDRGLASNLFWINLAVGVLLTLGFAGAGSLLAWFYGDPRLTYVAVGVSLSILFTSAGLLHSALLKRAMCFSAVSANDIVSRACSVAVSVLLAWLGWGYWALVAGILTQPLVNSVGVWILCRWIPSLPRRVSGQGAVVSFAAAVYSRWSLGYLAQNLDNLLVGWRFGSVQMGLYKKAYDLFSLPYSFLTIYPVAVSTLSRLNADAAQYRRYLAAGLSTLALVGMGIGGALTLTGPDVVRVLLGARWEASGKIFTFFGPGIGMMLIYSANGMIHQSLGTTRRYLTWGFVECTVTGLMFLLCLRWGPSGIAAAWTTSYWVLTIPAYWYAGKPVGFGVGSLLAVVWRYTAGSFLAVGMSALILGYLRPLAGMVGPVGAALRVMIGSLLFGVLYIAGIVLLYGGFGPLRKFAGAVGEMLPRAVAVETSTPQSEA